MVDAVLADRLCSAVAAKTRVPMLPVIPYGCSLGHSRRWPGTLFARRYLWALERLRTYDRLLTISRDW